VALAAVCLGADFAGPAAELAGPGAEAVAAAGAVDEAAVPAVAGRPGSPTIPENTASGKTAGELREVTTRPANAAMPVGQLGPQSCFHETLGNAPDVIFFPESLPGEMLGEGVLWIDLLEFSPEATSLINLTEMTKR
jgi:hypothetical protein